MAAVLGHEIGHFHGRDHLRGLGRGVVVQLSFAVAFGGTGGEALPGLVAGLADRGFGRRHESEADRFALALMQREYGHVAGADRFFERLPDAGDPGLDDRLAEYVSTHPLSAARIDELAAYARENGWPTNGDLSMLSVSTPEP